MFLLPTRQHEQRDAEGIMPGQVSQQPEMVLDCFSLSWEESHSLSVPPHRTEPRVTGLKTSYWFSPVSPIGFQHVPPSAQLRSNPELCSRGVYSPVNVG